MHSPWKIPGQTKLYKIKQNATKLDFPLVFMKDFFFLENQSYLKPFEILKIKIKNVSQMMRNTAEESSLCLDVVYGGVWCVVS